MLWREGNIIVSWKMGKTIVIPTNAGWKHNGENVMGRGIAAQIAKLIPDLPRIYGEHCKNLNPRVYLVEHRLIMLPSKPLIKAEPHMSWNQDADPNTVKESLIWLQEQEKQLPNEVYVPIIGAGNGNLDKSMIKGLMNSIFTSDKFIGLEWE